MGTKKELKGPEVQAKGLEMFKDGKLNHRCPHDFNWALGFVAPGMPAHVHSGKAPKGAHSAYEFPVAKVNGQHVVTWQ